jgi:hypothetical protein
MFEINELRRVFRPKGKEVTEDRINVHKLMKSFLISKKVK